MSEYTGEVQTREELISKLRKLVATEKFEIDAYFFCGFPSKKPNEKLRKACESYLEAADQGRPEEAVTARLIAELEAAAQAKPSGAVELASSPEEIQEILNRKELLLP